jgi:photosystem II stability/assembly factor-like uncharacterized protein
MKKTIILLISLFSITSLFSQDWQKVQSFEESGYFYTNVQWLSDSKVIVSRAGTLYISEDKGSTWTSHDLNNDSRWGNILDMHFLDQNTGFLSYKAEVSGSNAATNTMILKTTNGGETWNQLYNHPNSPVEIEFRSLYFVNESLGYAGGYYRKYDSTEVGYPGYFATIDTDSGVNGRILDFYTGSLNDGRIEAIAFINESTGLVFNGSKILKTSNGGENWIEVIDTAPSPEAPIHSYDCSFHMYDGKIFASFPNSIMVSLNDGDTWEDRAPSDTSAYDDLSIASDGTMYLYMDYGEAGLYKSTDMGFNWTIVFEAERFYSIFLQGYEGEERMETFAFADESVGVIVTTHGIYKTETGGVITDIQEETVTKNFRLSQNYPNPFNPSTTINFSMPEQTNVSLKIYDVLGKEVAELVNEEMSSGSYKVDFDAANLSSGIYFYTLKTNNQIQTRKMILMK